MATIHISDTDITSLPNIESLISVMDQPIEKIMKVLHDMFPHDASEETPEHLGFGKELLELEPEFILEQVGKKIQEIPDLFKEKIHAGLAIIVNPLEITQDLHAFMNTVLICNDSPINVDDGDLVPFYYISRTFQAVKEISNGLWDLSKAYLHENIKKYIMNCFEENDAWLLPDSLEYMENVYYESFFNSDRTAAFKTRAVEMRVIGKAIKELVNERRGEMVVQISSDKDTFLDKIFTDDLESKMDHIKYKMLHLYMMDYIYTTFYTDIFHEMQH